MKKILFIVITAFFAMATASYASIYNNNTETNETHGLYSNSTISEINSGGALYRSDPTTPGDRPGTGEGIGQGAPLGDGLEIFIVCVILFVVIKYIFDKIKKMWSN